MDDLQARIENEIIELFRANVQGKTPPDKVNISHDGEIGNWLELQFGIKANNNNSPDYKGYELKKDTRSKTTFGDWSADKYLFSKDVGACTRDQFIQIFGSPNPARGGRHSWSGSCVPKIDQVNEFGQSLRVSGEGSIFATYQYSNDKRIQKEDLVPQRFQRGDVALAIWEADSLRSRVENKFDTFGWFSVRRDRDGYYDSLVFGQKIDFSLWISGVRSGEIFLDSGMVEGNSRPYSSWRANNSYWDALIVRAIR